MFSHINTLESENNKFWEWLDLNPGLLGEKHEYYHIAIPLPPPLPIEIKNHLLSEGLTAAARLNSMVSFFSDSPEIDCLKVQYSPIMSLPFALVVCVYLCVSVCLSVRPFVLMVAKPG